MSHFKRVTSPETLTSSDTAIRAQVRIPLLAPAVMADVVTFRNLPDADEHILIGFKDWTTQDAPLVRVHSECLTGDVFGSALCDCGPQLKEALSIFEIEGGLLLYLRQEGRGIGLYNKLDAYLLQSSGLDTYQANEKLGFEKDSRGFASAAAMLKAVGKTKIRLLSNNPEKRRQLEECGIEVVGQRPTATHLNPHNRRYLLTKHLQSQHTLEVQP